MLRDTMDRIFDKVHDKGLQQGREQERLRTLARQLERKFGARGARLTELANLTNTQQDALVELIFDFDDEPSLFEAARATDQL